MLPLISILALLSGVILATLAQKAPPPFDVTLDSGSEGPYPTNRFHTSTLRPPNVQFKQWSPQCFSPTSHLFLTPKGHKVKSPGPMILDSQGHLVWMHHFDNAFGGQAYNLQVQDWKREKALTFWLGDDRIRGHGSGEWWILDQHYEVVAKVGGGEGGRGVDLHEFTISPGGTALVIMFEVVNFDVRPAGRRFNDVWNQFIWDCVVREIRVEGGEAVWEWRASEHLDLRASYKLLVGLNDGTADSPYDPWHLNSVEKDAAGNYLVSARYTHAVYYINGRTGELLWTLGGKNNTFADLSSGEALNFAWQHDARWVDPEPFNDFYTPPEGVEGQTVRLMTLFDNAAEDWNYKYGPDNARGLLLELTYASTLPALSTLVSAPDRGATPVLSSLSVADREKLTSISRLSHPYSVRILNTYTNHLAPRSSSQGSLQLLNSLFPHLVMGHGINAVVSTFHPDGTLICDLHFSASSAWEKADVQSYRAYEHEGWVGKPKWKPAAKRKGGKVWVSWTGATEVRSWVLQVWHEREGRWREVIEVEKTEFETEITVPEKWRRAKKLRVLAVDGDLGEMAGGATEVLHRRFVNTATFGQVDEISDWKGILLLAAVIAMAYLIAGRLRKRLRGRLTREWKLP
nr:hypothetical protein B0A51_00589 [Rachicladosporium sp. CCFEE 5018]